MTRPASSQPFIASSDSRLNSSIIEKAVRRRAAFLYYHLGDVAFCGVAVLGELMDQHRIIAETRRWIADIVIGLNLCPFARSVYEGERIRYAVTDASSESDLLVCLRTELDALSRSDPACLETTLVIHPLVLQDFLEYNDFLDEADHLLESMDLSGVVQIASFHPLYQFAKVPADHVSNYTNRSPYPMLHLLREESISRFAASEAELLAIPERNIKTLEGIGSRQIRRMLAQIRNAPDASDPPSALL